MRVNHNFKTNFVTVLNVFIKLHDERLSRKFGADIGDVVKVKVMEFFFVYFIPCYV